MMGWCLEGMELLGSHHHEVSHHQVHLTNNCPLTIAYPFYAHDHPETLGTIQTVGLFAAGVKPPVKYVKSPKNELATSVAMDIPKISVLDFLSTAVILPVVYKFMVG